MKRVLLTIALFFAVTAMCSAQSWRMADNHPQKRGMGPQVGVQVQIGQRPMYGQQYQRQYRQYRPRPTYQRPPRARPQYAPQQRCPHNYRSQSLQLYFGPHYNTQPYGQQYRPYGYQFHFRW